MGDELQEMLAQVALRPGDVELRGRAAEALDDAGRYADALGLLAPLVNLTGHDDDTELPCLCKRCFASAPATAAAQELSFVRAFAVVETRVLHFWMLEDQERERARVRASVTESLRARLASKTKKERV